jgi:UV DNA damage endonuclease
VRVRFGYVAIALGVPEGSPNKTATAKTLEKIADREGRFGRLRRLMRANLETTLRILRYNAAHEVSLYRFTSKTVPLATHPLAAGWDYIADGQPLWREIGDYVKLHGMRVSAHPDHYTLLNSPKPEVLAASLTDLDYHARMLVAMGLPPSPSLVLHVGGQYREKAAALRRFADRCAALPGRLAARLMVENDDKIFTAAEVLGLCEELGRPMVLDIHHHRVNGGGDLGELWPRIAATWGDGTPKVHVSSPKDDRDRRAHADYVDPADVLPFLRLARETGRDLDVMVEAKRKDEAMFRLVEELAAEPGVRRAGQAAVEL